MSYTRQKQKLPLQIKIAHYALITPTRIEIMNDHVSPRSKAPVFVLGCPRSGTTLLYYMLLSSGNFAIYQEESSVFNQLMPRFGDLRRRENRQKLLNVWFKTRLFTATGLPPEQLEHRILDECRNAGDFLCIVMEEMARSQGVARWAETSNEHVVILPLIKRMIPDALVIHVIRDGRDVALSMEKLGWLRRYPWNPQRGLMVHGLYWEWIVRQGRKGSRQLGPDYTEVRFEELVTRPHETLIKLGRFIEHDLDYDRILKNGLGPVCSPNTSFGHAGQRGFNPVGRWKNSYSAQQLAMFEGLVGNTLKELDYSLGTVGPGLDSSLEVRKMRLLYPRIFSVKKWLKFNTPLRRLFSPPETLLRSTVAQESERNDRLPGD
jgi:hypothetical protein